MKDVLDADLYINQDLSNLHLVVSKVGGFYDLLWRVPVENGTNDVLYLRWNQAAETFSVEPQTELEHNTKIRQTELDSLMTK